MIKLTKLKYLKKAVIIPALFFFIFSIPKPAAAKSFEIVSHNTTAFLDRDGKLSAEIEINFNFFDFASLFEFYYPYKNMKISKISILENGKLNDCNETNNINSGGRTDQLYFLSEINGITKLSVSFLSRKGNEKTLYINFTAEKTAVKYKNTAFLDLTGYSDYDINHLDYSLVIESADYIEAVIVPDSHDFKTDTVKNTFNMTAENMTAGKTVMSVLFDRDALGENAVEKPYDFRENYLIKNKNPLSNFYLGAFVTLVIYLIIFILIKIFVKPKKDESF